MKRKKRLRIADVLQNFIPLSSSSTRGRSYGLNVTLKAKVPAIKGSPLFDFIVYPPDNIVSGKAGCDRNNIFLRSYVLKLEIFAPENFLF